MKQHITRAELSEIDADTIIKYVGMGDMTNENIATYFTIGKMIEILEKMSGGYFNIRFEKDEYILEFETVIGNGVKSQYYNCIELCDVLFEVIKQMLNNGTNSE